MDNDFRANVKATVTKLADTMLENASAVPKILAVTLAGTALAAHLASAGIDREEAGLTLYSTGATFMDASADEFERIADMDLATLASTMLFAAYVLLTPEDYPSPEKKEESPTADDK